MNCYFYNSKFPNLINIMIFADCESQAQALLKEDVGNNFELYILHNVYRVVPQSNLEEDCG
jgi:hypothetical protein